MSEPVDYSWAIAHVLTGKMGAAFHCSICGDNRCGLVSGIVRPKYMGYSPGEEAAENIRQLNNMMRLAQEQELEDQKPHWLFRHMFDDQGNVI